MQALIVSPYCRVSTDKDDQANSFASQMKYFTEYIEKHENWRLGEVYFDEGITGTNIRKRDGFNRMIKDAIAGKMNLIITKEVTRFARNTVDTLVHTRKLKEHKVGVFFMNDNINTLDNDGELRLTIMASLAQEESRKTSERVKWGQKRRMEAGVVFGRDMLGYKIEGGKMHLNPEEAEIVKLIFHKFTNEGKGTHVIARELRESGISPMRAKEWSNTVILRLLRNEKYVGDLCQKKTYTPDFLSHAKKYNRGHEEKVYLRDHHEPIIDRDVWERAQKELARRSPNAEQKIKHSNRYWCSGKLICGDCDQRFIAKTKKLKSGSQYKAWVCFASQRSGSKKIDSFGNEVGCNNSCINEQTLLACVESAVKFVQSNKDEIIQEILSEIKSVQSSAIPVDTTALTAKLNELNGKKEKAIDLLLDGIISRDDLKRQIQGYDAEIERIARQLAVMQNTNQLYQAQSESLQTYIDEINNIMELGTENTMLYRELLEKIVIENDKSVHIYLNCIPYAIQIKYKTCGKGKTYSTEIEHIEVVQN